MDRINIVKMICGTLMAAGIYIPASALAGLLFKVIVIGADTLDAAIRRRDRKDPRLLLYSEISGSIYGLHGTALPLAAASMICAVPMKIICLRITKSICFGMETALSHGHRRWDHKQKL